MVTQIVVMGGKSYGSGTYQISSTEVLDVDTMTWGIGPPLPFEVFGNKGVESVSGSYLGFSSGGNTVHSTQQSTKHSKIYGLKNTSENMYIWEEVQSMTKARYIHSIVNAPSSLLPNC